MSSVPRFFVPPQVIVGDCAVLPPEAAHHARTVLRLRPGEALILHDGAGMAYRGVLREGTGKTVEVSIQETYLVQTEPTLRITVVQALPKTTDKVEQVLQHGTEIGAAGFVFFQAERSVARMESRDKIEKRLERWAEIVQSAAEQSGRGVLPPVAWEPRLAGLLPRLHDWGTVLVLHEKAGLPLRQVLPGISPERTTLCIIVGPEGGLTEGEVQQLRAAGGISVSLGPRILRTETAALVGLAQLLFAEPLSCDPRAEG